MTLGKREFVSKSQTTSVTSEVKCGQVGYQDCLVKVIDTPGLADTNLNKNKCVEIERMITNMKKVFEMCQEGIHAFVFVFKFGNRFTREEETTLHNLQQIFGHSFLAVHGIILFTHGDIFEQAMGDEGTPQKDFNQWCREQKGPLGDLMKECSYRCVLFNNRQKNVQQQETQMDSLIRLAQRFRNPYTHVDYWSCQHLRQKLIVESKEPLIREEFDGKIMRLRLEIEQICGTGRTTKDEFSSLEKSAAALSEAIDEQDRNTGVLKDLKKKVVSLQDEVRQHKKKQAKCTII